VPWSPGKRRRAAVSLDARVPQRRSEDLIVEPFGDELLVYDRISKRAHCLSATAAKVWQACGGLSDLAAISSELDLPLELVREAVEELEASELLDQGLELINVGSGDGNGRAMTRRELAVRSAKVGTAAAAAPLIVSLAVPSAAMAASPTFGQCAIYTSGSCGNNMGQCGFIAGCCCCCQYQGQAECKACTSLGTCPAALTGNTCGSLGGPGTRANCESGNTGSAAPVATGCCGPQGSPVATNCGCIYTSTGVIATTGAGGPGGGAGCCRPGATPSASVSCNPGDSGCVPCCNGNAISLNSPVACCPAPSGTSTAIGSCVACAPGVVTGC
jgi:hypothetical protein